MVKGLQIRRRLQAQYQRTDTGADPHGDTHDANTKGKPTIVVKVSSADPEPSSELPGSHDGATSEASGSRTEVRHPRGGPFSCGTGFIELTLFFGSQQAHHDPDLFHAGGFIATADEIVQPFSLPRSQYTRLRDRAPSPPASDDDVEMVPDSEGVIDEEPPAMNGRDSTMAIKGRRGYEGEGDEVLSGPEIPDEPMKTMAELAAEHAERQRQLGLGSTRGSKPPGRRVRSRRNAVIDGGKGEPGVDEDEDLSAPSPSDYLSDSPAPSKQPKATSSTTPSRANPQSSKRTNRPRKKRARSPDADEGSDMECDRSSVPKSATAGTRPKRKTTTVKPTPRASRTVSGHNATSIAVPGSDRVLRSRKGKV